MKREHISIEDAVGKSIEAVVVGHLHSSICIALSDQTFVVLTAIRNKYDDASDVAFEADGTFDWHVFKAAELEEALGVDTIDAWKAEDVRIKEEVAKNQEVRERNQLAALKVKYED